MFKGVDVILIPDRDAAGEEGAQHSAKVLRGQSQSICTAVLPAEFKESGGEDVRDVLRRPDGRNLVLQAIADAKSEESGQCGCEDGDVSAEVQLPEGDPLTLTVSPTFGKPQRLVVAKRGEIAHRDRINTDSAVSRNRLIKQLGTKLGIELDVLVPLVDPQITAIADQVDEQVGEGAIRLKMGIYTHIGLHDQTTAIESLPAPPSLTPRKASDAAELRATGTDDAQPVAKKVPTVVPRGAENGAIHLASIA
jgi:hypothetical protein